jgi:gamma-glutamylcyclotransferase (GGCT)/AIG2-like uncharacterized protein YtfP
MPNLFFVYGTLRDPDLLALLLGRPLSGEARLAAVAPGYRAVAWGDRPYPALIVAPGGAAEGLVLTDISSFEAELLDAYEGDEYRRAVLPVLIEAELHEALAYLPITPPPAAAPDWRLGDWQVNQKPATLVSERIAAAERRQQLLARRPN